MTAKEFGQHFEGLRPRLVAHGRKKGLTFPEAEDLAQTAAVDLLPKCSQYPNGKALARAFNIAMEFGLKRARRSWSQRRESQIEVRAQQGLTGTQTPAAEPERNDWNDEPEHVGNHGSSNLLEPCFDESEEGPFDVEEPSEPEREPDQAPVSDRGRITYGYGQLSADERDAENAQIRALERQQIINRAPATVRPILQRLTEGASFRDVAKEQGISKTALRQRLSRYRRNNFLHGCHKWAVSDDLYSADSSPL